MSAPGDTVRTFVALVLDDEMRRKLEALASSLRPRMPGARWVRPEGVHLTLRFLGDTPPERIERLEADLSAAAAASSPAEVGVRGLDTFPGRGKPPRVLWVGLEVPASVDELQAACEAAAVAAGFPAEERPFRAHLTLARFRERVLRPALPPTDLGTVRLHTLALVRSELRPGGAVYTPIARFALGAGG